MKNIKYLLKEIMSAFIGNKKNGKWIIAVPDCAPGLCNPKMKLAKDDLNITSSTGHWERHVLAKIFGVSNVLSEELNQLKTETHRQMIFGTPHGVGCNRAEISLLGMILNGK